jgi:osmotically-inducible protein OsmY
MKYIICLLLLITSSACAPAIFGAGAATSVVIAQERTAGDAVDDATITAKIKSEFLQKNFDDLFASVHVKTNEGRVMLTGSVPNAETRVNAVRISWNQKGVKEVINELKIAHKTGELGVKDYSVDAWVTTQVKAKLLLEKDIHSINYNIETLNGTVYLLGIAQDQHELDRVINIVKDIKHVNKVTNYVRLKNDPKRDKQ